MRGKHVRAVSPGQFSAGSSPHARETPELLETLRAQNRLIPACAGNTVKLAPSWRNTTAHPRMRGKHESTPVSVSDSHGSSPHARETPQQRRAASRNERLIPACAGNTCCGPRNRRLWPAHPRMRGKHRLAPMIRDTPCGSSPHARETPAGRARRSAIPRLIPACAGNTSERSHGPSARTAHPRMRGKHRSCRAGSCRKYGSSPHARETLNDFRLKTGRHRLIPACAGNTVSAREVRGEHPAHPRMRGKHGESAMRERPIIGSSPHARETLRLDVSTTSHPRLIPACAGNTAYGV